MRSHDVVQVGQSNPNQDWAGPKGNRRRINSPN